MKGLFYNIIACVVLTSGLGTPNCLLLFLQNDRTEQETICLPHCRSHNLRYCCHSLLTRIFARSSAYCWTLCASLIGVFVDRFIVSWPALHSSRIRSQLSKLVGIVLSTSLSSVMESQDSQSCVQNEPYTSIKNKASNFLMQCIKMRKQNDMFLTFPFSSNTLKAAKAEIYAT